MYYYSIKENNEKAEFNVNYFDNFYLIWLLSVVEQIKTKIKSDRKQVADILII